MRNLAFLLLALALVLAGCATPQQAGKAPRALTILISVDGLRPDYLTRGVTPNLDALAAAGVHAVAMRPSFPSLTFPNHYSLVTGMRPDRHGVVNNRMEDAAIGTPFSLGDRDAVGDRRWWDGAEPVWITAEKAGIRTATMFWPGSEAPVGGVRPSRWLPFDGAMPNPARVAQLLAWLDEPARPQFLTLYFDTVDHDGHEFGPDAPETTAAVAEVDAQIGELVAGLRARGRAANIVIVSDHGMAKVAPDRTIRLDLMLPAASFRVVTAGAVTGLEALPDQDAVLAAALLQPRAHLQCWRKADIPARLHYGRNPRVPAFVCLADPGWMVATGPPRPESRLAGMHGYDPAAPEMAAVFIAAGPAFRSGTIVPAFDNVDVYPLLMKLLGLRPLPSDASKSLARHALQLRRAAPGAAPTPDLAADRLRR